MGILRPLEIHVGIAERPFKRPKKLAKDNLCLWHSLKEKNIKRFRKKKLTLNDKNTFFKNLLKIGYSRFDKKSLITAFQRRFRQELINGKIDKECFLISKNLIKL